MGVRLSLRPRISLRYIQKESETLTDLVTIGMGIMHLQVWIYTISYSNLVTVRTYDVEVTRGTIRVKLCTVKTFEDTQLHYGNSGPRIYIYIYIVYDWDKASLDLRW